MAIYIGHNIIVYLEILILYIGLYIGHILAIYIIIYLEILIIYIGLI